MWETFKAAMGAVDKAFEKCASVLIITGAIIVTLTVVIQVVLRYVLKLPLFGLEEFSRLIAVWIYFLGAYYGTRDDSHVQGDVAARLFTTARSQSILKTVTWALSLLACALFLYHAGTYSFWLYGTGERTTGLWWPRIYTVGSMFVGALLMTIYSLANVVKHLEITMAMAAGPAGGES
jgi:TRAP-type C4-dicarboxylate transport system permease small subunit